ncbi:MAG: DUF2784 domain-containing protein [Burkholderiales bacterium]
MGWRIAADAVVALHLAFIVFAVAGGFLVLRDRRVAFLHLPAVAWVVWLEFTGALCPLTPLENALRRAAGESGYPGGFIEHYLLPVIYPAGLTADVQVLLGAGALAVNVAVYALVWRRRRVG